MQLDKNKYGISCGDAQLYRYDHWQKVEKPRIEERGYCPIKDRKVLGRYKYYSVAHRVPHDIVVAYRDLDRFGYAESNNNWMKDMLEGKKNVTRNTKSAN